MLIGGSCGTIAIGSASVRRAQEMGMIQDKPSETASGQWKILSGDVTQTVSNLISENNLAWETEILKKDPQLWQSSNIWQRLRGWLTRKKD